MCGIVGYTGRGRAAGILLRGLGALEYRGYDSAGIALSETPLAVFKCGGRVSALAGMVPPSSARAGIGHTRWATHGVPCAENAHPHLSFDGTLAIVHNGVIENCDELRAECTARGIPLASQTDSELAAHLLALDGGDIPERLFRLAKRVKGAFTVLVLREGDDKVYAYKRGASLVVSSGKTGCYVASDAAALPRSCKRATVLSDGECAVLSPDGTFRTMTEKGVSDEHISVVLSGRGSSRGGCRMRAEMDETPSALLATFASFCSPFKGKAEALARLRTCSRVLLFGCGTAYHACLAGKGMMERVAGKPCEAYPAGEAEDIPFCGDDILAVFVTQSGETADTLRAMEECKRRGAFTLAVTNCEGSTASVKSDACLPLAAGAETAVAATKSYCCQILALWLIAKSAEGSGGEKEAVIDLSAKCAEALKLRLPPELCLSPKLLFIGRGIDSVTAREGALKFKEVTWLPADAYPASELKHGPIALADNDCTVIAVLTDAGNVPRIRASVSELRSRGSKVVVCSAAGDVGGDVTLPLPVAEECLLMPAVAVIPLQRLALECAEQLGRDPDKPRNLAKSVTVI